ncbi:MAG: hypothetical protein ACE5E7_06470 [Anaerolineae bacterium]
MIVLIGIMLMAWPIAAGAPLPARETPGAAPVGGFIRLSLATPDTGELWTAVQWRDHQGLWHDVQGWQGSLDEGNVKTWWVSEETLGAGPFRWVVYDGPGGAELGTSQTFSLPAKANEVVVVEVAVTAGTNRGSQPVPPAAPTPESPRRNRSIPELLNREGLIVLH